MVDVPEVFAREIMDREGVEGERWLASLPALVEELLEVLELYAHRAGDARQGRDRGACAASRRVFRGPEGLVPTPWQRARADCLRLVVGPWGRAAARA